MKNLCEFDYSSPDKDIASLKRSIVYKLMFIVGTFPEYATESDWLNATSYAIRDRLVERWLKSTKAEISPEIKQVYYISMEFLMGRFLTNAMLSLGVYQEVKQALLELGLDLGSQIDLEPDPGLGNGGLGRLAACFLDSCATLGYPVMGYGIRYEYGMFRQKIINGEQHEIADNWLENGNPWEFPRHEAQFQVNFGGRLQQENDKSLWIDTLNVVAQPYDSIVPGYNTQATDTIRLWSAKANNALNLGKFNKGEYLEATEAKDRSENISRILYPDDSTLSGKMLRLQQEYFLVSASVQDILQRHYHLHNRFDNLKESIAIHLNDTHPVLAIPELMRQLIDNHAMSWDDAWEQTICIFSYTNHTLMGEALETWPVEMIGRALPRHLQIIFQLNDKFLKQVKTQFPDDNDLLRRVSIIDEDNGRNIRMAWLAVIICHQVNGVSELHSQLMVQSLFTDFAMIYPKKFCNITNGITPRRWLALANPPLSNVIDSYIGEGWRTNLEQLGELMPLVKETKFLHQLKDAKRMNKQNLAKLIQQKMGITINPDALFDVQIKRIHEYKRQLLNVLGIITRYNRILQNPEKNWVPRVFIFGGKAASAYYNAKKIINLINDIASTINNDERIKDKLKVIFIPNYGVSLAQKIIPAADLSEQISLAGTEASGTGNMKFALNGALTIGTLDGANIEIGEHVGFDNMFIFGNNAQEVAALRQRYSPRRYYDEDIELHTVLNQIANGFFNNNDPDKYKSIFNSLIEFGDHYQVLADYRSYVDTHDKVDALYHDENAWLRKSALNICQMGYFSADRAVTEYMQRIWKATAISLK
ncbi:glycogen phosphorylase [Proteus hauseri ATCC 700826]|uniref:Alpha-1,4 glucan phosphorylase n=1 Tax=Proteus hauseri ATCC 700826 TaxID=1354271 RepID=A0AAJ3LTZ5_PROHU|nr:glycogen/starch/alpha-glucan family phosphorylase [Proteus hauseri]OAT46498.1 glycogen phosphorylase [Proteus hauseri ATCC 700826]